MTLVLVAHGTQDPAGTAVTHEVAAQVRARLPRVPVHVAFASDVSGVLDSVAGRAVVVPAFLASGYHVRVDIPAQVGPRARIAEPLGPAPALVAAAHDRLIATGWRRGDAVVLAAAGSSDPRALADTRRAALLLSARTGSPVDIGYVTTAFPRIADAIRSASTKGRRVAVASWLLAPGLFHQTVLASGADLVADPLGAHPRVADQIVRRYRLAAGSGG
jgi:sirohydrochlorin ferrochelatase